MSTAETVLAIYKEDLVNAQRNLKHLQNQGLKVLASFRAKHIKDLESKIKELS